MEADDPRPSAARSVAEKRPTIAVSITPNAITASCPISTGHASAAIVRTSRHMPVLPLGMDSLGSMLLVRPAQGSRAQRLFNGRRGALDAHVEAEAFVAVGGA